MRYYTESDTLFVRGSFRAASTGINGGIRSVSTLLNHTLVPGRDTADAEKELEITAANAGIGGGYFGLLTAVPAGQACILQYDFITVFITAGIRREGSGSTGTINILITSSIEFIKSEVPGRTKCKFKFVAVVPCFFSTDYWPNFRHRHS